MTSTLFILGLIRMDFYSKTCLICGELQNVQCVVYQQFSFKVRLQFEHLLKLVFFKM